MLGTADYVIWFISLLLEVAVAVCILHRREFLRYLPLNLYLFSNALTSCGLYFCSEKFGFRSAEYFYSYYSSDILLSVLMCFVIGEIFRQVFAGSAASQYVRGAAGILLGCSALFAYLAVRQYGDQLTKQFVVELEQDLNFVGVVLSYALLGAVIKLRETRVRLVQLSLSLGVYFSALAGTYALRNLFPVLGSSVLRWLPPIISLWLPLAWAYTFMRVPEDARLAPAHVPVGAQ